MKKAYNRLWDWFFHPSIRWNHYSRGGKSAWFRYPSPGSIPYKEHQVPDYKTPFQYSQYNVRYNKPVQQLTPSNGNYFMVDGANVTQIDKLKGVGLLKGQQNPTQQKINQAKKQYLQLLGVPVSQRHYLSQIDMIIPVGADREAFRALAQQKYKQQRQHRKVERDQVYNSKHIHHPNTVWLESLDMFCAPHFQQSRTQANLKLDQLANQNADRGYIQIQKGQKSFWKAIDNSNEPKNIQKVQKALGDEAPLVQNRRWTKIQFEKDSNGDVVDVKPKTRFV